MATISPLGFSQIPNNFETNNKRLSKSKSILKNDAYTPNSDLFLSNKPQTPMNKNSTQLPYQLETEIKMLNFNTFSSCKFFINISIQNIL